MALFLGTLLITILSCLALGIGLLLRGQPLSGGCGTRPTARVAVQRKPAMENPRGDRSCPDQCW